MWSRPADSHQTVTREAAVVPAEHVAGVIGIEQAAAGEPTQHASAYLLGDGGNNPGCQRSSLEESDRPLVTRDEHTVEDAAVVVGVAVERGAETTHEAYRAKPCLCVGPWAGLAKTGLDDPKEDMQNSADDPGFSLQEVAQTLRHRQYPLAQRQRQDDALRVAGGNRKAAAEIWRMLLDQFPEYPPRLDGTLAAEDHEALQEVAHRIVGSAAICCAQALQGAAATLEKAA